jgi:hypothetical protein
MYTESIRQRRVTITGTEVGNIERERKINLVIYIKIHTATQEIGKGLSALPVIAVIKYRVGGYTTTDPYGLLREGVFYITQINLLRA